MNGLDILVALIPIADCSAFGSRRLAEVDRLDLARRLANYYQCLDARDCEFRTPATLWHEQLYSSATPKMNGRPLAV
jgi:hypothetical protein